MAEPAHHILESIEQGKIYFFSKESEIGVANHRHIFITSIDNGENFIFMATTTKFPTILRLIEKRRLSESTLVYIPACSPCFREDTYINCNDPKIISKSDFLESYSKGHIDIKGVLSDSHYNKIITGLIESAMVPTELKESLPPLVSDISA